MVLLSVVRALLPQPGPPAPPETIGSPGEVPPEKEQELHSWFTILPGVERQMSRWLQAAKSFWARWNDVAGACVLAALALYFLSGRFTTVRFDRELIDVEVEEGLIHVQGLYHYQNASRLPALLTLATPFPVDKDHPAPDTFNLFEVDEARRVVKELELRGPHVAPTVRLLFLPRQAKWIQLDYWQITRVHEGRYLLTTTRAWGRPIAHACFRLQLPAGYHLNSSNYPVIEIPGARWPSAFTFSKTDFFPDQDWRFSWQEERLASASHVGGVP